MIDLSQIPIPTLTDELSFEAILDDRIAEFKEKIVNVYPNYEISRADPVYKNIEVIAAGEFMMRQRLNDAARRSIAYYHDVLKNLDLLKVNGSGSVYEYYARTVEGVKDCYVFSPEDSSTVKTGKINIIVYLEDQENLEQTEIDKKIEEVKGVILRKSVRAITDVISVKEADIVDIHVSISLILPPGVSPEIIKEKAREGIKEYIKSIRKIGRDIQLKGLISSVFVKNVVDCSVTLNSLENNVEISRDQIARFIFELDDDEKIIIAHTISNDSNVGVEEWNG